MKLTPLAIILLLLGAGLAAPARSSGEAGPETPSAGAAATELAAIAAEPSAACPAGPPRRLGLADALRLAREKSPVLRSRGYLSEAARADRRQAGLLPNPRLSLELEEFGGTGEYQNGDRLAATAVVSQPLELGGKRAARVELADANAEAADLERAAAELGLGHAVTRTWLEALAARERLRLAAEAAVVAGEVCRAVTERVEAGRVSPIEADKAQVELGRARIALERARRRLVQSLGGLSANWGEADACFDLAEADFYCLGPTPAFDPLAGRLTTSPALARAAAELARGEARTRLERTSARPDLEVGLGARYLAETSDTAYVAELSVPLPLANRNQGAIESARLQAMSAAEEKNAAEFEARAALEQTYHRLCLARTEAETICLELLPRAESAFAAVREGYEAGKFGYLEALEAERALFELKAERIEAVLAHHLARLELAALVGDPVPPLWAGAEDQAAPTPAGCALGGDSR